MISRSDNTGSEDDICTRIAKLAKIRAPTRQRAITPREFLLRNSKFVFAKLDRRRCGSNHKTRQQRLFAGKKVESFQCHFPLSFNLVPDENISSRNAPSRCKSVKDRNSSITNRYTTNNTILHTFASVYRSTGRSVSSVPSRDVRSDVKVRPVPTLGTFLDCCARHTETHGRHARDHCRFVRALRCHV